MSTWRRSVFALGWATGWGLQAAGRAVTYVAAGALTRETLRAAIARNWETFGLDESYILSGLMPWEQECYDRFLRPEDTILLVGCGTGRDLIALLRRGHHVEGLEPAGPALEIAQQMLDKLELRASLHRGAIEATELPRTYDVVIFSWYCYGYVPESRVRVAVLEKARAALAPGGRIILPYMPSPRRRTLPVRLTRLVARLTGSDWRPEDGDRVWVSLADWRFVHFEHQFEEAEVQAEARAAGLRVVFDRRDGEHVCVLTR